MSQTSSNIIHLLSQLLFVCTHTQHGHVLFVRVHVRCVHIRLYLYLLSLYKTQELKEWGGRMGIQSPEYEC